MKKIISVFLVLTMIFTLFSITSAALSGVKIKSYKIKSISDSGLTRTTFKPNIVKLSDNSSLKKASLPEEYSSVDKNRVTAVKDQGDYGSCWAFSAVSCAESSLISQYPEKFTLENTDLSEVHHAYFTYSSANDKLQLTNDKTVIKNDNFLDVGGNLYYSTFSFAKSFGAVNEDSVVTYDEVDPSIKIDDEEAYIENVATLKNAFWIDGGDIQTIKQMIKKYGSVSASCYYDYTTYNEDNAAMYCGIKQFGNHQITLVGWDDNFSKVNFGRNKLSSVLSISRPNKDGAWLVKNSYGEEDGIDGYFWLSYYDKALTAESACVYDFEPVQKNENKYQYDGSLNLGAVYTFGNEVYGANVFTASGWEILDKISFISSDNAQTYYYKIYVNTDGKSPVSGTPVYSSWQKANVKYAGYNTIALKEPIQLRANQHFSILLKAVNKTGYPTISTDISSTQDSTGLVKTITSYKKGQSYISADGKTWSDSVKEKTDNIRLKAMTHKGKIYSTKVSASNITLVNGKSKAISLKITPAFAVNDFIYKSSNTKIATVASNGKVTAKAPGSCKITISSKKNPAVKCIITVKINPASVTGLKATKITKNSVTLTWNKVAGASGYSVYILQNGKKKLLKNLNKLTYKATGLKAKTKYTFYIRAYKTAGETKYYSEYKSKTATTSKK